MGTLKNRKNPRTQISLVARYRSPTAFEFVREECFDLSIGGMFIKSDVPAPSGTLLKLDCDVDDGVDHIRGVARVVWLREFDSDEQPAGMGVKFVKLEPGARETIQGLLQRMGGDNGASPEARGSVAAPMPQSARPQARAVSSAPQGPEASAASTAATEHGTLPMSTSGSNAAAEATTSQPSATEPALTAQAAAAEQPHVEAVPPRGNREARNLRARLRQVEAAGAENVAHVHDTSQPHAESADARTHAHDATAAGATRTTEFATESPGRSTPAQAATPSESFRPVHQGASVAAANDASPATTTAAKAAASTPAASSSASKPASAPSHRASAAPFAWKPPVYAAAALIAAIVFYSTVLRSTSEPAPTVEPPVAESALVEPPVQVPEPALAPEPTLAPEPAPVAPIEAPAPLPAAVIPEAVPVPEPAPVVVAPAPKPKPKPAKPVPAAAAPVVAAPPPAKRSVPAPAPIAAPKPAAPAPNAPVVAVAPPAPAPIAAPPTPTPAAEKQTPMQAAVACLSTGDNACVISALEGKAKTARELELLIETYRATGESAKATKQMHAYLNKFPDEKRAATYRQVLDRQQPAPVTP